MSNDLAAVEQAVRDILAQAPGGRVILPRLGQLLRAGLPGFSPQAYGFMSLKALLEKIPLPGRLVRTSLDWWLVSDGAEVPDAGSPPASSSAARPQRIDNVWWRAITEFDESRGAWLDLGNEHLSTDAAAAAAEPERFICVPRYGLGPQREMARAWAEEQADPGREQLLLALDTDPALAGFLRVAQGLRLLQSWSARRIEVISSALLDWARDHGLSPQLFFVSVRPSSAVKPRARALPGARDEPLIRPLTLDELRELLRSIVGEMTEPELMQIPIPARFLLRR